MWVGVWQAGKRTQALYYGQGVGKKFQALVPAPVSSFRDEYGKASN